MAEELDRPLSFLEIETELADAIESDAGEEVIAAYLGGALDKRDRVAGARRALKARHDLAAQEIARLRDRKYFSKAALERLDKHILAAAAATGHTRFEGRTSTLRIQKNGARKMEIQDEGSIPAEFKIIETITVVSVNEDAVKAALLAGREVPGAILMPQGSHVREDERAARKSSRLSVNNPPQLLTESSRTA